MGIARREVDTSHMGCIRLQTSGYIIATGERMDWPTHILIQCGEIDHKSKFPALFGNKPSRSAKLRMLVRFHPSDDTLQFQITHQILRLGFELCRNRAWFETVK